MVNFLMQNKSVKIVKRNSIKMLNIIVANEVYII